MPYCAPNSNFCWVWQQVSIRKNAFRKIDDISTAVAQRMPEYSPRMLIMLAPFYFEQRLIPPDFNINTNWPAHQRDQSITCVQRSRLQGLRLLRRTGSFLQLCNSKNKDLCIIMIPLVLAHARFYSPILLPYFTFSPSKCV